jgi:hypothetical protein
VFDDFPNVAPITVPDTVADLAGALDVSPAGDLASGLDPSTFADLLSSIGL